ncbi:MAG: pyridoxamine 5'-phosphate oxidase family protein, partial [Pseudomonadota bacterium]
TPAQSPAQSPDRTSKRTPALPDADLNAMVAEAWRRLTRGAADKRSAFNTTTVGTMGAQGWPEMRTVVLRQADPSQRRLVFHTDRRSTKAGEIEADGRLSLLFWDPRAKLQLRVWGQARLLTEDPLVDDEWRRLAPGSRDIYRVPMTPGRLIDDPSVAEGTSDGDGRDVFAVVPVTVMRIDWLHLRAENHRRARFDVGPDGWHGRWLAP